MDIGCKYFKKIPSMVPFFHEEKVCSEKLPKNQEVYNFDTYRCNCENHLECDTFKQLNLLEKKLDKNSPD